MRIMRYNALASSHGARIHAFGGSSVGHVQEHFLGAVHIEYLAAGALHKTAARLARSIAGRLKPLAGIPQRVFSRGPISLIAPRLKIG
jgi:hypothetical protein